ncbi:MAG TPA: DUF2269 family protein [Candidatus Limnocylindria bacterium]|nr:DUF2269 family protein [Candidatus Limnocylindria bacterium]
MDVYPWLKTVHVMLAIVAVGTNVTYGIWQARAGREPQHILWTLRGVKFLDDRVANPSYIALAVVGVLLVLTGPWEFEMLWIAVSIGLYILLAVVGLFLYSPTLSRQIGVYETDGPASPEFSALTGRSRLLGALMGVLVAVIVVLMVVKPGA